MREDALAEGGGGGLSGGFPHRDGVAGHAVAGVGDKVAADAASGHQQPVDVGGDQGRQRNVVRFGTGAAKAGDLFRVAAVIEQVVNVEAEVGLADRVGVPLAADDIVAGDRVTAADPSPFPDADLFRGPPGRR